MQLKISTIVCIITVITDEKLKCSFEYNDYLFHHGFLSHNPKINHVLKVGDILELEVEHLPKKNNSSRADTFTILKISSYNDPRSNSTIRLSKKINALARDNDVFKGAIQALSIFESTSVNKNIYVTDEDTYGLPGF